MSDILRVALWGAFGHQISGLLANHPYAQLVAFGGMDKDRIHESVRHTPGLKAYGSLDELLADDNVDLVSFCSDRRDTQVDECIGALNAGKHVYAEKPSALTEDKLDALEAAIKASKGHYREMAETVWNEPFTSLRETVLAGTVGDVVQVFAQKSYPMHDHRPQDEMKDGGLTMQVGIHAMRMVQQCTGHLLESVSCLETQVGNPKEGDLRIASTLQGHLSNGGLATIIANYCNPKGFGSWGNEHVRVFGEKGFVELTDGGSRTRLVVGEEDRGSLEPKQRDDYFTMYCKEIQGIANMPVPLSEELHATRMVIRAFWDAKK